MKTEIKVGLFVILSLAALLLLTFQIKTLEKLKEKGYVIYAIVNDASGLNKKSRVKMRGVKIGAIDNMQLQEEGVRLKLIIKKEVKIPVGSEVVVAQDNVLGGKYLKIIPSNSKEYYKPGDVIKKYLKTASMEDVMNNINSAVSELRVMINRVNDKLLDNETLSYVKNIMKNIEIASAKVNDILELTHKKLPRLFKNANDLMLSYKKTGDILREKTPVLAEKLNKLIDNANLVLNDVKVKFNTLADEYTNVGKNVNIMLKENNKTIKQTIIAAKDFFANGSESFKKIDNMLASFNKSELVVDITTSYLTKDDDYLTIANVAYKPTPTKYYILGIASRKDYSTLPFKDENKLYVNAELGKRYGNILLRGGVIESTGGVGIDYFMNKDKVKFTGEIYDFNSANDKRGDNPHLNFKATYLYLKHLEFLAGVDNVLNTEARSFFLGVGIKFKDNDLKPFISGGATSFLK